MTLTYSGKMSDSAKARKRRRAGCKRGYCAKLGQPGLNSCDEFPPASTDEGGDTLPTLERAINRIPEVQNSRQGQKFSTMVRTSGIQKGQTFVLSINCDKVLGSIVPRDVFPRDADEDDDNLAKRDVIDLSGISGAENIFTPEVGLNETTNTLVVGFGDLGSGSYSVKFTVEAGTVEPGGFIVDNMGDEFSRVTSTSSLERGDSASLSFSIEPEGELMGVGLILLTRNSNTTISWKLVGEDLKASSTGRGTDSPTSTEGTSEADSGTGASGIDRTRMQWPAFIYFLVAISCFVL